VETVADDSRDERVLPDDHARLYITCLGLCLTLDLEAKYNADADLQRTKLVFTCLRPGALHNGPATGALLGITQMAKEGVTDISSVDDLVQKLLPASCELVAQMLLACAEEPRTARLNIDVMDGDRGVKEEVARCAMDQVDGWKADEH